MLSIDDQFLNSPYSVSKYSSGQKVSLKIKIALESSFELSL